MFLGGLDQDGETWEAAKSDDIDDKDGQGVDPNLTEDIDDADVAGAGISDERGSLVGSLVGAEVTHVKLVEMASRYEDEGDDGEGEEDTGDEEAEECC